MPASSTSGMNEHSVLRMQEADRRRRIVAENTQFLLDMGEHPDRVATRLGYSNRDNLKRVLARVNRQDLIDRLSRDDLPDGSAGWWKDVARKGSRTAEANV